MNKLLLYIQDRFGSIVVKCILVGLGVLLFMLERYRHAALIDLASMTYYIVLSLITIIVWHVVEYIRYRPYYASLEEALSNDGPLEAIYIVQDEIKREQQLMKQLLINQQRKYKSQLQELERKREIQHHFTLQWVHQMKTPLSVIDLHLQHVDEQLKHGAALSLAEQAQLYRSMHEEADKLHNGLELMLNSARLEKLELDLHVRPVELHSVVRDVVNRYKKLFIQHSIFPKLTGEATAATDHKWFAFIINQLLSNAIKFSKLKEGTKSLYITIEQQGDETSVTIKDEGIGIDSSDIKRVFDPFFTGKNGRISGESTGMGLYLAKQVCLRLGHTLTVSSKEQEGAAFTLTIKESGIHRLQER